MLLILRSFIWGVQGEGFKRHFKKFIEISIDVVETFTTEHDFDFYFFVEKLHIFFQLFLYSFETLPKCVKNIKLVVVESKYL